MIEKWESMEHLKAHAASAHMKSYAEKVKDKLADWLEMYVRVMELSYWTSSTCTADRRRCDARVTSSTSTCTSSATAHRARRS